MVEVDPATPVVGAAGEVPLIATVEVTGPRLLVRRV
jgi:hypothetical protein